MAAKHTPAPWEYVPGNENHGPYVANHWGAGDICDCYVMSNPRDYAICNGGTSRPINHQGEEADANARLIAAAPEMYEALKLVMQHGRIDDSEHRMNLVAAAIAKAEGRSND